jgi:hypothetical protein
MVKNAKPIALNAPESKIYKVCELCPELPAFSTKSSYYTHVQRKHEAQKQDYLVKDKKFTCDQCGAKFNDLRYHRKSCKPLQQAEGQEVLIPKAPASKKISKSKPASKQSSPKVNKVPLVLSRKLLTLSEFHLR